MSERNLPVPASYVPGSQGNRRVTHTARQAGPKWMDDPDKRDRIFGIYEDYLRCLTIPEIMTKWKVSFRTVYRDIDRARQVARSQWESAVGDLLADRISARRRIMRQADEEIEKLHRTKVAGDKKAARAAQLLAVKSDQEDVIDFLLGFGKGKDRQDLLGPENAPNAVVAVIMGVKGLNVAVDLDAPPVFEGQARTLSSVPADEDDDGEEDN